MFLFAGLIGLSAFHAPSPATTGVVEKNLVFQFNYESSSNTLTATEKMEVSSDLVERNIAGHIASVDKSTLLSQWRMSARLVQSLSTSRPVSEGEYYALVSFRVPGEKNRGIDTPSDEQLLDYLKATARGFARHEFRSGDWNCAGSLCHDVVPAGVEVYVWKQVK